MRRGTAARQSLGKGGKPNVNLLSQGALLFQRLTDANIIGIVTADENHVLTANDEFLRLTGYARADLKAGRINWLKITPAEYAAIDHKNLLAVQRQGWCAPYEKENYRKDGSRVPILLGAARLTKKPFTCVCFVQDLTAQKQAEADLRASEERLRALVELSPDIISIFDRQGRLTFNSAAAGKVHGYRADDLAGVSTFDFIHPEDRASVQAAFERLVKHKAKAEAVCYRYRNADGSYKWMEATARNELANTHIQGVIAVSRDISERKRVEEALRASESRLDVLVQTAPAAIVIHDTAGRLLRANKLAEELLGLPAAKATGKSLSDPAWRFLREDGSPMPVKEYPVAQVLAKRKPLTNYICGIQRSPRGDVVWVLVNAMPRFADGKIVEVVVASVNITQRKLAEDALRQLNATLDLRVADRTAALRASEEKFRLLFSTVADAVFLIDAESRQILEANPAAAKMYGYAREKLLRLNAMEITAQPAASEESIARTLAGLPGHVRVRWHRKKDGTVFPVEISSSTFNWAGQALYCGVVRDITRQLEMEREILSISEREQQRIAQDLHDDLCQELTGVHFLAETLARNLADGSRTEWVAARKIAELIRGALTKTRELSHGLAPVDLARDGLAAALRQLCARIADVFHRKCVFHCRSSASLPDSGAGIHLYRIAQEAVNNAIKHGKASRIDIALAVRGNNLILKVRDNGGGIPPPPQNSTNGMGLRVMQYRAAMLGGAVAVRRHPRGGTEVVCTVAAKMPPAKAGKAR